MRVIAFDPVRVLGVSEGAGRGRDAHPRVAPRAVGLRVDPPAGLPGHPGTDRSAPARDGEARRAPGETSRGGHRGRGRVGEGARGRTPRSARRSTSSPWSPSTDSPLFGLDQVVVTPHLGASTVEAQDKAGTTVAEMVRLALEGQFVPYAVNVVRRRRSERGGPSVRGPCRTARRARGGPGRMAASARSSRPTWAGSRSTTPGCSPSRS